MIDLNEIRNRIEGPHEEARYQAWLELYLSPLPEADTELNRIIKDKDAILKIRLIKFLSQISEEKAVNFLVDLLLDENPVVVETVKRAFDLNQYSLKLQKLLSLISSDSAVARDYAIEKMSQAGLIEALDPLLKLLPQAKNGLLLRILSALRYFPDKRILSHISGYINSTDEEVKFRTILAYGALYEEGYGQVRNVLVSCLHDPSPRLRQSILWSLRRRPDSSNLKIFLNLSNNDPDPMVRQESLLELAYFPTKKVIAHLLSLLANEKNRLVALRAEAILLSMPTKQVIKGLKTVLKAKDERVRSKAVLLFADFNRESKHFIRYLIKCLRKTKADKDKFLYIEALGVSESIEALPILETFLTQSYLIAYTAVAAILKIVDRHKSLPLLLYLENPKINALIKQSILQYLIRKSKKEAFNEGMVQCLIRLLNEDNLNIRYLSSKALIKSNHNLILDPLLKLILKEEDVEFLKLLKDSILKIMLENPSTLVAIVQQHIVNPEIIQVVFNIIKEVDLSESQIISLIPPLIESPLYLLKSSYKDVCADFFISQLVRNKISLEKLLDVASGYEERNTLLSILMQQFKTYPAFHPSLSVSKLKQWFEEDVFKKGYLIDLMGFGEGREPLSFLTKIVCNEKMKEYHSHASQSLNKIIGAAHD